MVQESGCGGCERRRSFFYDLKACLCEAARVYTRYDIPDKTTKETRRERNERVGEYCPELVIPDYGRYIWNWFVSLNQSISRIKDGVCQPLPPSEVLAWCKLTETIVYPVEYDILQGMDDAFCEETNLEFESIRSKQQEEQKRQMDEARSKSRRRR